MKEYVYLLLLTILFRINARANICSFRDAQFIRDLLAFREGECNVYSVKQNLCLSNDQWNNCSPK